MVENDQNSIGRNTLVIKINTSLNVVIDRIR